MEAIAELLEENVLDHDRFDEQRHKEVERSVHENVSTEAVVFGYDQLECVGQELAGLHGEENGEAEICDDRCQEAVVGDDALAVWFPFGEDKCEDDVLEAGDGEDSVVFVAAEMFVGCVLEGNVPVHGLEMVVADELEENGEDKMEEERHDGAE